jgi:hypothetical protein
VSAQPVVEATANRPGSDGVDGTNNPLEVSITTNSTGPLNIVATVCSLAESGEPY